jgi:putative ABC transport system permease protein
MISNYFKIAFRGLLKNKIYSFINIIGLALGMTSGLLIFLWINDEYKIDRFHENGDRIFAIVSREYIDGVVTGYYDTPGLLGEELKRVMPEVEFSCGFSSSGRNVFSVGEKVVGYEGNFAGEDYFKIFSMMLLQGTPEMALKSPESISISHKMAKDLFGSAENAINQTVRFNKYKNLTVTAVFEDLKDNASIRFDYLINWTFFKEREPWALNWHNSGPGTFALLKKNTDPKKVEAKIKDFIAKYDNEYKENDHLELGLQPYQEMYLHSNFKNGYISGGRIEYVRIFGIIAIFILIIACINFMNLSTAQSLKRAKGIGVRKYIGAPRSSLVGQFLVEAFLCTSLAVLFSVILTLFVLPVFNQFTGKQISVPLSDPLFGLFVLGGTIFTALFAGSYPSIFLSGFRPISALKNNFKIGGGSIVLRKGLVVFQFMLSFSFIIGMIIISKQIDYIYTKNLGYKKDNLVYIPKTGTLGTNYSVFKQEAEKLAGVISLSNMHLEFTDLENTTSDVEWLGKTPNTNPNFFELAVGYDFLKTMQAEMIEGREFSEAFSDSANYVINEAALKIIGYKDPIGKSLKFWDIKGTIVGVVKDFHFRPLNKPIEPLIMRLTKDQSWGYSLIRIAPDKTQIALSELAQLYKKINPEFPFSYQFVEDEYRKSYNSENHLQKLLKYFAGLAILISCLGLLGLIIFSAEQRTKEIGIRKVLGASIAGITGLLAKDFLKLVLIAILIASPIAWYLMNNWLADFAYRIDIQWWMFVAAGVVALAIAFLTVGGQAVKAALANPVRSLRSE